MFIHNKPSPLTQGKSKNAKLKNEEDKWQLHISLSVKVVRGLTF
jgi:hypothetical protein